MSGELYQILYCSRNSIKGTAAEIDAKIASILAASRINNKAEGVTGSLIFNSVSFAQILEGPMEAVERTFERILRDARHTDLTVLQTGPIQVRKFPAWSMALASSIAPQAGPLITHACPSYQFGPTTSGMDIFAMLRKLVIQEEQWATTLLSKQASVVSKPLQREAKIFKLPETSSNSSSWHL